MNDLDEKVQEVLENGGILWAGWDRAGRETYRYERLSRDGRPLTGREAKHPPRYRLTATGVLMLHCTCQAFRETRRPCKHLKALACYQSGRGLDFLLEGLG